MTTPEQCHQAILAAAPVAEDHDFSLITDGSGTDVTQVGTGSAWILRPVACRASFEVLAGECGSTFGSIQRAELTALTEGLRALAAALGLDTWKKIRSYVEGVTNTKPDNITQMPEACRARVWWVSDRESIVLQVARKPDGTTYYTRRTEPDIWCTLWWYEHLFRITPVFIKRNTFPDQVDVDARAGRSRAKFLPAT